MLEEKLYLGNFDSEDAAIAAVRAADPKGKVQSFLHGYDGYYNTWDSQEIYTDKVTAWAPGQL